MVDTSALEIASYYNIMIRDAATKDGFAISQNPKNSSDFSLAARILDNTLRYNVAVWAKDYSGGKVTGVYSNMSGGATTNSVGKRMVTFKIGNFNDRNINTTLCLTNIMGTTKSSAYTATGNDILTFDPVTKTVKIRTGTEAMKSLTDTNKSYKVNDFNDVKLITERFVQEGSTKLKIEYYLNNEFLGAGEFLDKVPTAGSVSLFFAMETNDTNPSTLSWPADVCIDDYWISNVPQAPITDAVFKWTGFFNSNNMLLKSLEENKEITFSASIKGGSADKNMTMIIALYNKDNKLVNIKTKIVKVIKNENVLENVSLLSPSFADAARAKYFIVDDLVKLKPLITGEIISNPNVN